MDLASLRSLVREVNFATHGVPAVVTIPLGAPVSTRIIWLSPTTAPTPEGEFGRNEARRSMAIRRDEVPLVPRETVVAVTEHLQSEPTAWVVDGMDAIFHDHHRVVVVPQHTEG